MSTQLDFAALETCLQSLDDLFIDIQRLRPEVGYEEKRGGYGDVQVSRLDPETSGTKLVAAKTVRLKGRFKEHQRLAFRLARELKVWAGLRHPHVLALLGYYLDKDYKIAVLISEYVMHGDLKDYIEREKPVWDKRLFLIRDLTDGLAYLHSRTPPVRHGDLKPGNVLITATQRAILADFGLSKALEEGPTGLTTSEGLKGTLRYYSPEIIKEADACHSLPSDIWAWACLVVEVLTDRIPYAEKKSEHSIIIALMNHEPPNDTTTLPIPVSALKELLSGCWTIDPDKRPSAERCLRILNSETCSPPVTVAAESVPNPPKNLQYISFNRANLPDHSSRPVDESTPSSQSASPGPSSQHVHYSDFFAAEFHAWRKSRDILPYPLYFCGKEVALHRLFLWVGVLGGGCVVTEKKLWPAIGAKILFLDVTNQSLYPVPAVADQLFKYYEDTLAKFELHWNNLFRACDPNVTFPLPPHLRYLRPEIERFAYDLLPVILHPARPDGKESELVLQPQRLTKAKQAEDTSNPPREGASQISAEKRLPLGLETTRRLGFGAPRALQPQDHFPEPNDDQTSRVIPFSLSNLNISPDQQVKAREKVTAVTEFYRNTAAHYPLLDLSHDERTLLERSIQQVNTMVKQVSQIIVPLFAITNDEHELWEVAKAVVALDQAQILLEHPTEKRFVFGLNRFNEYKNRLVRFLARGQELQNQGLAYQHLHPPNTQSLSLTDAPF